MSTMKCKPRKICIIGAGNVGLINLRTFLKKGHDVTCFEQRSNIGGMWNFEVKPGEENLGYTNLNPDGSISCAYNQLCLNTSKIGFFNSDILEIGLDLYPDTVHLHWPQVLEMLNMWAEKRGLLQHIRLNTEVIKLTKGNNYWTVSYKELDKGQSEIQTKQFDFIVCCTGGYRYPRTPNIPNIQSFKGLAIHSSQVRLEKELYPGKTVLVIGASFSGSDMVSYALKNKAYKVFWSESRHPEEIGHWLIDNSPTESNPHFSADACYSRYKKFERLDLNQKYLASICFPLHDYYKGRYIRLPRDQVGVAEVPYIQNQERIGRLQKVGPISSMTSSRAVMKSGLELDAIDILVYCTGYDTRFPVLDEHLTEEEQVKCELYYHMLPVDDRLQGLAIAGICDAQQGLVTLYELQARWLCKFWLNREYDCEGKLYTKQEINNMKTAIQQVKTMKEKANLRFYFIDNAYGMFDTFAHEIGCLPPDYKELITKGTKEDVELGVALMKGPVYSMQYRIQGDDYYENAAQFVINAVKYYQDEEEFKLFVRQAMKDPQEFLNSFGISEKPYVVKPCFPAVLKN